MPYIHCPRCRLTVYGGIAYHDRKECPRCGIEMRQRPRPLFRSFTLDDGRPKPRPGEAGNQFASGT